MDMRGVLFIARRELAESLRRKWVWAYAIAFAALALGLARASASSAGYSGLGGFGRTSASLVNALLLFVPLVGLSVGAAALVADRERGVLAYLFAQPLSLPEIFAGKALGAAAAVGVTLLAGLGVTAVFLGADGGGAATLLWLGAYAALLALATLGVGLLVGACVSRSSTAAGASFLVWLVLVFLGDAAFLVAAIAFQPPPQTLFLLVAGNPAQAFKLGAVYGMQGTLDVLGAVGRYAEWAYGPWLAALLAGVLLAWALASGALAFLVFRRRARA